MRTDYKCDVGIGDASIESYRSDVELNPGIYNIDKVQDEYVLRVQKATIKIETIEVPSKNKRMKPDKIIRQTFTCCNKKLEKILWEGWDWIDGNIIDNELTEEFKYCPYCGKKLYLEGRINA